MKTLYFKTNIPNEAAKIALADILNKEVGIIKWDLDLTRPEKLLRVFVSTLQENDLILMVNQIGYTAQPTIPEERF